MHGLQTVHDLPGELSFKHGWSEVAVDDPFSDQDPADEDKMLFCDLCDRGYHIYCVGLPAIPQGKTTSQTKIFL